MCLKGQNWVIFLSWLVMLGLHWKFCALYQPQAHCTCAFYAKSCIFGRSKNWVGVEASHMVMVVAAHMDTIHIRHQPKS